jgi:hypothetical protein
MVSAIAYDTLRAAAKNESPTLKEIAPTADYLHVLFVDGWKSGFLSWCFVEESPALRAGPSNFRSGKEGLYDPAPD